MEFHSESKIIERADLLSPETVPERITGRPEQIEMLSQCLKPMEIGAAPLSAWLYGPTGTGKTAVARNVAQRICNCQRRIWLYVNCWERPTLYSVIRALCDQLSILGADSLDTNVKLARIREALKDKTTLIILDEIDRPMPRERDSIIYNLLQIPKAGLFCIACDRAAFFHLEDRVRSKLTPTQVHLPQYSIAEIEVILAERARDSLMPDAYNNIILQRIASLARGDARKALYILLKTAVAAEKDRTDRMAARHIPADTLAWQQWEQNSRVESLPQHQRLIYELARKHGEISSTKLRGLYLVGCYKESLEPAAHRTFSKYVKILAQNNFLSIEPKVTGGSGRLIKVTLPG